MPKQINVTNGIANNLRNLCTAALNEAINKGVMTLQRPDEKFSTEFECQLFGKRSLVRCEGDDIGHLVAFITLWWDVPECIKGISILDFTKKQYNSIGLRVGFWLSRENGCFIEGQGGSDLMLERMSRTARNNLMGIDNVRPYGFEKEGARFMEWLYAKK